MIDRCNRIRKRMRWRLIMKYIIDIWRWWCLRRKNIHIRNLIVKLSLWRKVKKKRLRGWGMKGHCMRVHKLKWHWKLEILTLKNLYDCSYFCFICGSSNYLWNLLIFDKNKRNIKQKYQNFGMFSRESEKFILIIAIGIENAGFSSGFHFRFFFN